MMKTNNKGIGKQLSGTNGGANNGVGEKPFVVLVSPVFLLLSGIGCIGIAFVFGGICRHVMYEQLIESGSILRTDLLGSHENRGLVSSSSNLPKMYLSENKPAPKTIYSSKTFTDESIHASSATVLAEKRSTSLLSPSSAEVCLSKTGEDCNAPGYTDNDVPKVGGGDAEEVHEPAGQHLLVDMQNIDEGFLNSETRIAQAMVDIITVSGLTMLSYHCHALQPMGVSCVGVLLESHISVHTWPLEGIILLDLFTCGPSPLFPLLPLIEKTFGLPKTFSSPADAIERHRPNMNWSHKKRGFRGSDGDDGVQGFDIDRFIVGWLEFEMKTIVASVDTDFQTIDIYDVINPRFLHWEQHYKSLTTTYNDDGTQTYESLHPELFRPDRLVFMNGVLQSRRFGDNAYHEALVHPAMITHPHPKRVAIIGGGEGATLREVLKHNTIESVVMVEIDPGMVDVSRQYLPEWNDCRNIEGRAACCFDDATVDLQLVDAGQWFIDRFVNKDTIKEEDKFDVIIMDSLDPQDMVEFSSTLLSSDDFIQSIVNSLTTDGVFVSQIGEDDVPGKIPDFYLEEHQFVERLAESGGFLSIRNYFEPHGGFYGPWKFAIAFKSYESKFRWFFNQAEIDYQIRLRLVGANDGSESLLYYYDGATHASYHDPSRITEDSYCLKQPSPPYCENGHGFDPYVENINIQSLEVRPSQIEGAGRGIFFKRDFPKGTYVSIDSGSSNLFFGASTTRYIEELSKLGFTDQWKTFDYYLFGYGFSHDYYGDNGFSVDGSILTFINHGCNRTYNMGEDAPFTELDADTNGMPDLIYESVLETTVYSPFIDRNHLVYINAWDMLNRDVKAGEELLDNYLHYLHEVNWNSGVMDFRAQCLKQAAGVIRQYEQEATE